MKIILANDGLEQNYWLRADLSGRVGFGMPTFDHPVVGTCVAVGHPGSRDGTRAVEMGWGGGGGQMGGRWGGLSSVRGRDRAVGSSGRRRQCARSLGDSPAAVVASLGVVFALCRPKEGCCCCGDFGGG